jgi:cell division protein FtsL
MSARTRTARYYGREATARIPQLSPEVERTQPLPKPRLVSRRRPQWPMIFVALLFAAVLLGVSIVSPMLLSAGVAQVESQVGRMENNQAQLSANVAALSSQISTLSAPDRVAEQAKHLGLQPAEKVHYVPSGMAGTEGDTTVANR